MLPCCLYSLTYLHRPMRLSSQMPSAFRASVHWTIPCPMPMILRESGASEMFELCCALSWAICISGSSWSCARAATLIELCSSSQPLFSLPDPPRPSYTLPLLLRLSSAIGDIGATLVAIGRLSAPDLFGLESFELCNRFIQFLLYCLL